MLTSKYHTVEYALQTYILFALDMHKYGKDAVCFVKNRRTDLPSMQTPYRRLQDTANAIAFTLTCTNSNMCRP